MSYRTVSSALHKSVPDFGKIISFSAENCRHSSDSSFLQRPTDTPGSGRFSYPPCEQACNLSFEDYMLALNT